MPTDDLFTVLRQIHRSMLITPAPNGLALYLLQQDDRFAGGAYTSAVVVASSAEAARLVHPRHTQEDPIAWEPNEEDWDTTEKRRDWVHPTRVTATRLGSADPRLPDGSVICASQV